MATLDLPPLAEIHVHLEGTLEPELILALAERNRLRLRYHEPDELRARYHFTDLQSFLDIYYANLAVLRTEEDFADMTAAYLRRAAEAGVRHAEVFLDPQAHTARGVGLGTALGGVAAALDAGRSRLGLSSELIVCFLRERGPAEAMATLEEVLGAGVEVLGVGLDSTEVGHPPGVFADVFARARAAGLIGVAHAGEEGPAAYVWEALEQLRVARIDHGIRSLDDEALVARLVADRVPLTVCPLSNVRLHTVPSLEAHPLADMLRRGLVVSVNSDDPAYFGGYVDDNLAAVVGALHLTRPEVAGLARHSLRASVLPPARRAELLAGVDAWEGSPASAAAPVG